MGILCTRKEISTDKIKSGDSFTVTLTLTAGPEAASGTLDLMLLLDCSGSLSNTSFDRVKSAAKNFISQAAAAAAGNAHTLGKDLRMGIVGFADSAELTVGLTDSVAELCSGIDRMCAKGRTNHGGAFTAAIEGMAGSKSRKVFVMITDGITTAGNPPAPIAKAAKEQGIEIFIAGLNGCEGLDKTALEHWVSSPSENHMFLTDCTAPVEDVMSAIAHSIFCGGISHVCVTERVANCFTIVSVEPTCYGYAVMTDPQTIFWCIPQLGNMTNETAKLSFRVKDTGTCCGKVKVNDTLTYQDDQGNCPAFDDPSIVIQCGGEICPEECPEGTDIILDHCCDSAEMNCGLIKMECLGRILKISVTLKNVCPNKSAALAAILTEVDKKGQEHNRGMKTVVIPPVPGAECRDVTIRCIPFVVPEEKPCHCGCCDASLCRPRHFKVRFIANYTDTDFVCCD